MFPFWILDYLHWGDVAFAGCLPLIEIWKQNKSKQIRRNLHYWHEEEHNVKAKWVLSNRRQQQIRSTFHKNREDTTAVIWFYEALVELEGHGKQYLDTELWGLCERWAAKAVV